ncbi:MAG: tetratricopeptide repeat protein [Armatimonadota bacterium]|jgi:hypothetical protein
MLQELRRVEELIEEGDLVAAQRMCKRLLQQHPTNAAVHEAMGDVMRRRELWEDAAEWYDLAAQLHETEALKAKRADVLQRARESRRGGPEPHLVEDADAPRKMLLWLGIAAAAMLLVAVGVIFSIARDGDEPAPRISSTTRGTGADRPSGGIPGLTSPSPVRSTREAPGPGTSTQAAPRATANPEQHWAASAVPYRAPRRTVTTRSATGISASSPDPVTDHDQAVINAVSSLTWGDNRPMTGRVSAMVEPYSGYAMISVTIPQSIPVNGLVEEVVRQSWRVAVAAVRADEVITSLTIRMVRVTENGERVVAFRGNTTRRALENVNLERPDFGTLWNQVFASTWWNPQAGGEPPVRAEGSDGGNGAS